MRKSELEVVFAIARNSDHPAIKQALDDLCITVKLCASDQIQERIELAKTVDSLLDALDQIKRKT